jgi:Uma2 family endonuclease
MTQRDLDDTPDDGNRYEVIDGVLYVTPFPTTAHQSAVTNIVALLVQHVFDAGSGKVFTSGLKVVLDEPTGVGPDVVYLANERMAGLRADGYYGAPDMVVEVLSSRPALDTQIKKDKYARAGIRYYWIVDAAKRTLWEYRLAEGAYVLVTEARGEDEFRPELFPGLAILLGRLWLDPLAD